MRDERAYTEPHPYPSSGQSVHSWEFWWLPSLSSLCSQHELHTSAATQTEARTKKTAPVHAAAVVVHHTAAKIMVCIAYPMIVAMVDRDMPRTTATLVFVRSLGIQLKLSNYNMFMNEYLWSVN